MSDLVSPLPHQRKAQITCTAIFIVWGVLVHLVIPPFVFMVTEEWDYIEGLYYSFITISTIGFGDFVAGESGPLPSPLASASPPSLSASQSQFICPSLGAPGGISVLGTYSTQWGPDPTLPVAGGNQGTGSLQVTFPFPFLGTSFHSFLPHLQNLGT